ncbi:50S ribosomal protein L25/general stress protein Ctc [Orientia tsutsugamushi]|uniref:Large ribosomal subunit protein bL25 n=1 Tax=Orientia tsutsugamushi (strain Boryong) TaxID=357244 RepID=RL25_ORITB|nr:50S ribosomal protein L25/general stress protein Ctc [Orientia tsutsugamushi]A5CF34.1 RecName: Full=Large ribosomal subunit protein bL25; AltName: Full=50S ribosomal protein L25; AltName: Full=General stress protein CTC [Orientia tsutsugamushi str. Boryong]CAM80897.1 50S ribosomal protein L25 [Orientia tsutsugamushi str. Boryong]
MNEMLTLVGQLRSDFGTSSARALRRQGKVPGVIYKKGITPIHVCTLEKEVAKLYRKPFFSSTVIQLQVDDQRFKVLPKAVQLHPVTEFMNHIDFILVEQNGSMQKVKVPISFEGKEKSLGIKRGGYLNIVKRYVDLLCPVDKIPQCIKCDIANVSVGASIKISRLELPEGCNLVKSTTDYVIASVIGKSSKQDKEEEGTAEDGADSK